MPAPNNARMTVCYEITDGKAFDASEYPHIRDLFIRDKPTPFRITAMSADHEIDRVSLIEEAIERYGQSGKAATTIREIIQCPDLSKWSWDAA